MSWLDVLLGRRFLEEPLAAALAAHRALPRPDPRAPLAGARLIVVDVEASGLDPARDRLLSIGAVAVRGGLVRLNETFEVVLRQDRPSAPDNIVVHRIGGAAQTGGCEPAAALMDFLAFCGKDPLVAFHAPFDRLLIERATRARLGYRPDNVWFDLALLAPALFPGRVAGRTLDDWLHEFRIENHDRHNALADAVATAHLLLAALSSARRQGIDNRKALFGLQRDYHWLRRH